MKRINRALTLAFQLLAVNVCLAQFPQVSLFSTGSDAAGTGVQTYNSADLHWMASITGSTGTYVQARVCDWAYSGWQQTPWTNAQWISYPHNCVSTDIADHTCMSTYLTTWYKLEISLPCNSYTAQNAYCLTMDYFADNAISEIYVNGVLNYTTSLSNPFFGYEFTSQNSVALCNGWKAGTNTILVAIASESGAPTSWEALLATFSATPNVTGMPPVSVSGSTTICRGSATQLSATGAQNYTWAPSNVTGSSFNTNPQTTTSYTLIAAYENGCTTSKVVTVNVSDCTSLTDLASGEAPFTIDRSGEKITLRTSGNAFVTDLSGRVVATSTKEREVDISQLKEGIYILVGEGARPFREKFVKEGTK